SVTPTDIYFTYDHGMGNVKLKNLDPELQKKFHFDPAKAQEREKEQRQATAKFSAWQTANQSHNKATVVTPGREDPTVSVSVAEPTVDYQTYSMARPEGLRGGKIASTRYVFEFNSDFDVRSRSANRQSNVQFDGVRIALALPIKVIEPVGAT